ncbi:oxidoreductase [Gordonia sp. (in: high G+C Gram-positive bacteria)]|uniref:oxidoreductase n=1 Tax=Gordonia sp. (in: high G+C Gram-positive bacteria) TaxID=84139 RepID=UPI003F9DEC30
MTSTTTTLSAPLELPCGATLPNRIAKAAMSEQLALRDGSPSDRLRRLYAVWARSGAGLLLTGNIMIDRDALTEPGNVILDDGRAMTAVRDWTSAATQAGASIWAQLSHPGKVAVSPFNRRPVAPSPVRSDVPGYSFRKPRELTARDIDDLIRKFARSAELAMAGGFDGVQVHGAHGYLLSQFLSPLSNRRTDSWGSDPVARQRLLLEVVAAVRDTVGADVPVGVKLNSKDFTHGGFENDESLAVAVALAEAGIDLLEISGGSYEEPAMTGVAVGQKERAHEAYFIDFARQVRHETSVPLLLTGGMRTPAHMEALVADDIVDVVGIGRPMTFVPDYPSRVLAGDRPRLPQNPPTVGYRPANGYLELAWHNDQLHRIAAGRAPQRRPGLRTLVRSMARISKAAIAQARIPR